MPGNRRIKWEKTRKKSVGNQNNNRIRGIMEHVNDNAKKMYK